MRGQKFIIGIDEAGRGPLAGPVSVAAIAIPKILYRSILREFKDVKDSKKISEKVREAWIKKIRNHPSEAILYSASLVGSRTIDKKGIVKAITIALTRSLQKLKIEPRRSFLLLDGSLYAPDRFKNQKTIIRGDEKEKIIALASIVAKVKRDGHMKRKAKEFPNYDFEIHKGYGTKKHIQKIRKHGLSDIHRKSFLGNFLGDLNV
jgi:ribonuclease HII